MVVNRKGIFTRERQPKSAARYLKLRYLNLWCCIYPPAYLCFYLFLFIIPSSTLSSNGFCIDSSFNKNCEEWNQNFWLFLKKQNMFWYFSFICRILPANRMHERRFHSWKTTKIRRPFLAPALCTAALASKKKELSKRRFVLQCGKPLTILLIFLKHCTPIVLCRWNRISN